MKHRKTTTRQHWLAEFERRVVEQSPAHAGKINWNAATHLFNQGHDLDEAVQRFIASEQPVERRGP